MNLRRKKVQFFIYSLFCYYYHYYLLLILLLFLSFSSGSWFVDILLVKNYLYNFFLGIVHWNELIKPIIDEWINKVWHQSASSVCFLLFQFHFQYNKAAKSSAVCLITLWLLFVMSGSLHMDMDIIRHQIYHCSSAKMVQRTTQQ